MREAFNALRGIFPRDSNLGGTLDVLEVRGYAEVVAPPRDRSGRPPTPTV